MPDQVEEEIDAPEQAAEPGRDPYATGPTGYTGFQTYADNNAGASKASAQKVNQKVAGAASGAQDALQQAYGAFQGNALDAQQERAEGRTNAQSADGGYTGPGGFDPSQALTQAYGAAGEQLGALGSTGGVQSLMGPRTSRFGAALTYDAGAKDFGETQGKYAGLGGEIGSAQSKGAGLVNTLKGPMDYQAALQLQRDDVQSRAAQARQAEADRIRNMQGSAGYAPPPDPDDGGYRGINLIPNDED